MKKLIIGLAAVLVLLDVAVIAIPFLVPLETFKDDITAGVEDATGRKLEIAGKMLLSLYPSVAIERFVLIRPVIALEVDKTGKTNWDFDDSKDKQKPEESAKAGDSSGDDLGLARLGDIRLVDGKFSHRDHQSGQIQSIENINMSISLPDLDGALDAKGWLKLDVDGSGKDPQTPVWPLRVI